MRLVVKVGTSTLAHSTGLLNIRHIESLCKVLADIKNAGHEVVLVSSGAIGMGAGKLPIQGRPTDMPTKQAAAAVGQCELMYTYDKLFTGHNHVVAQLLLTKDDISHEDRRKNVENTLLRLIELGAIPIVNENDTVATEEIAVGDNDTLSAITAVCTKADILVILSDINGLYTKDPHTDKNAQIISEVREITPELLEIAGCSASSLGTGGMYTKIQAAKIATQAGIDMIIINGAKPEHLYDIIEGKSVGTRFFA